MAAAEKFKSPETAGAAAKEAAHVLPELREESEDEDVRTAAVDGFQLCSLRL